MQQETPEATDATYRNVYSYALSEEVENTKTYRRIGAYAYVSFLPVSGLVMFICLNAGLPEWVASAAA